MDTRKYSVWQITRKFPNNDSLGSDYVTPRSQCGSRKHEKSKNVMRSQQSKEVRKVDF